ncbi:RNA methyltransferase [Flammeovirgaceae bacterium SG7u.111]|nr:RNA methyltransferase [Flammeovirgaceae bacterium SG7u.132]WPO36656.1 RNA methyltransferase [Flammeovirgaceae bacterium SG7u.111]
MSKTLPKKFEERMKKQLGDDFKAFEAALKKDSPVSVRLNPLKPTQKFEGLPQIPWCTEGRYLSERPSFVTDPLIFAGTYYVQEASSMFLSTVLKQAVSLEDPLRVLDLCAAPGGKSTLINSLISSKSMLLSNELVTKRAVPLMENLVRWGHSNAFVSSSNVDDFEGIDDYFDVAVVDAPCSGEGMFRKDPKTALAWSENFVATCSIRQKSLLEAIAPSIKPGGLLIYSTCTYSPNENEEALQWLADQGDFEVVKIKLEENWGIDTIEVAGLEGYRFYPHKVEGEGFFMACLRKKSDGYPVKFPKIPKKGGPRLERLPKKYISLLEPWIKSTEGFEFFLQEEQVWAVKKEFVQDLKLLNAKLDMKMAGLEMGKFKNKKFIPAHPLAMSEELNPKVKSLELDYGQAISYLRRQELDLDTQGLQGWAIARFEGVNLGWMKVLPGRINNYYPMDLRIRKEI